MSYTTNVIAKNIAATNRSKLSAEEKKKLHAEFERLTNLARVIKNTILTTGKATCPEADEFFSSPLIKGVVRKNQKKNGFFSGITAEEFYQDFVMFMLGEKGLIAWKDNKKTTICEFIYQECRSHGNFGHYMTVRYNNVITGPFDKIEKDGTKKRVYGAVRPVHVVSFDAPAGKDNDKKRDLYDVIGEEDSSFDAADNLAEDDPENRQYMALDKEGENEEEDSYDPFDEALFTLAESPVFAKFEECLQMGAFDCMFYLALVKDTKSESNTGKNAVRLANAIASYYGSEKHFDTTADVQRHVNTIRKRIARGDKEKLYEAMKALHLVA